MNTIKATTALLLLTFSLEACALPPTVYKSEPAEAWVVDAVTGKPIEGAIVIAHWEMSVHGQKVTDDLYSPKIIETVTDSNGHFVIPGWGPEKVCCGFMDESDPAILIFKPDYEGFGYSNSYSYIVDDPKDRTHYWNGAHFKLQPYQGNYEGEQGKKDFDHFENFSDGQIVFGFLTVRPKRCDWKLIPKFLSAIKQQSAIFSAHGYKDYSSVIQYLEQNDSNSSDIFRDCGSPKKFLEDIGQ